MTPAHFPTTTVDDEARKELDEAQLRERMGAVRRRLLILSGKGGVGKSTVPTCGGASRSAIPCRFRCWASWRT